VVYEHELAMKLLRKMSGTEKDSGNVGYLCRAEFIYTIHLVDSDGF
jgi:hypothetical protein